MTTGKLRIAQTVEQTGYEVFDGYLFAKDETIPPFCTITLTLEQLP